ncbi:Chk1 protein kinase [Diaporthe eres]
MEGSAIQDEQLDSTLDPPPRIFERLSQIAGYTWDESAALTHSSYDNWSPPSTSSRVSPGEPPSSASNGPLSEASMNDDSTAGAVVEEAVVARVSYHVLREERAFHTMKNLISTADPNQDHTIMPLDLIRLAPQPGDRGQIIVSIYQSPGQSLLPKIMDLGPAFYTCMKVEDKWVSSIHDSHQLGPPISLNLFLDFAIGATQCLEMIHHGLGIIHGELRGDSFHYNEETNKVKLITFGSGLRSFEHGLTSTGWSSLSRELGAKHKLLHISPEQTGRMPAEPDTRTDIYSLGVLFWMLLTQSPVFEGDTPLDIVQGVLGKRVPNVSTIRLDVPDVLGRIIQKCTAKNVGDRYHSASGLRHDLVKVQGFLYDNDWLALKEWRIASRDVSSFFMLPSMMIGRQRERADLLRVVERVAKSHAMSQKGQNRFSDGSTWSNDMLDGGDVSSEGASSEGGNRHSGSYTTMTDPKSLWPMLHKLLGLPEFLIGPVDATVSRSMSNSSGATIQRNRAPGALRRRGSSPGGTSTPPRSSYRGSAMSTSGSQDFLRTGASTKSLRLMNTFLDVLRMFSQHKFICFVLEDLHFADDESIELITQIISARLRLVIIITYRSDEMSPDKVNNIISPPESEDLPKFGSPIVTRIPLSPLGEEEIVQYVSTTLCKPKEEILPLALVIQSKSGGNPYDYKTNQWEFSLDQLFEEFQGKQNYDVLDTISMVDEGFSDLKATEQLLTSETQVPEAFDFITRRLNEMPEASKCLLAWAALLGHSFSFELICHLLSGECQDACGQSPAEHIHKTYTQEEAVAGLQAAIQAYIIVPGDVDDRFRFGNLPSGPGLVKYYAEDGKSKDNIASHICESVDIIRQRVSIRRPYRQLLFDCAKLSTERGARPTAAKFYTNAVALLQPDPWNDQAEDVSYEETNQLYLRAAECYLYMGNHGAANALLGTIFLSARSAFDKAPASVLRSRIFAQAGDAEEALACLLQSLRELGVPFDDNPTYEKCDAEFERLAAKIRSMERSEIINPRHTVDTNLASIGAVLADAISSAWWSNCLMFYHLSLVMVDVHLTRGAFPSSGMAFLHLSMVALSRHSLTELALDLGSICLDLLDKYRDAFSMARGYMLYANFVGHIHYPLSVAVNQVEGAVEYATVAGDRTSTILSFGLLAQLKFFASENCADLEAFCQYGCEDVPNWHQDTRGGTLLIAVRQVARALQGKTRNLIADEVMNDTQTSHNSASYKAWLEANAKNGGRSLIWYETMEIIPLFLFSHYEKAAQLGKHCVANEHIIWSARNTRAAMLFYGLSLAGLLFRKIEDPRTKDNDIDEQVEATVETLVMLRRKITDWEVVSDVNYLPWSTFLQAQIHELKSEHGSAIRAYEDALDHASEQNLVFEEALGNYLMAGVFIRRGARRSAKSALRDAVGLFRLMGATGLADRIEEEHSLLLHGPTRNPRTAEASAQTDFAGDAAPVQFHHVDGEAEEPGQPAQVAMGELHENRIGAWRGSMHQPEAGAGLPALDMIDLHAILVSSQVISSILDVQELLKTMADVVLRCCGGTATLAAIIVDEKSQWCVAASGDPEKGAQAHKPGIPLSASQHLVAENVVLYCTRFREAVFSADIISDERFGVSEQWLQKNPQGRAIIAYPISHGSNPLLGVLYLEGNPNSFTDRNVTVLQLLVNQIGISFSNALSLKAIEKVSSENASMIESQQRALLKAQEAETKAKAAEAEARRNEKRAEEAAKAKSIFLANVSHELRTPLNGVIGNSELLKDSNLSKEQLEMADSIRVSADLLLTVINDILDFSKMEADKMKLYITAFNPEEMVREVVRAQSYSNREKTTRQNVKIIKDINLPPMLIYGDPIRLHQVLGNLISNSLKFTEDGSVTIGSRLDSETNDKATLTFWVKDTGIGISAEQKAKLFQPFSQADTSTARKYGGSGLGLSICRSLIETMMKGKIELDSQQNIGTTAWFTVTFDKANPDVTAGDPRALPETFSRRSSDNVNREPSPNPYLDLSQIPKESLRVCIAEDNAINQKIAIQYIQRLGYKYVDAYDNGLKAVEGLRQKALEGEPYHVILMDVQMPVMDGYDATKLLRKDSLEAVRKILVIAMTASAIQGDREKCLAAGMNDYLAKPVRSDVLKKKLDTYVGGQAPPDRKVSDVSVASVQSATATSPPPSLLEHNGSLVPVKENKQLLSSGTDHNPKSKQDIPGPPSRTSSDNRLSDTGSIESAAGKVRNKLTKNRLSQDSSGAAESKGKEKEKAKAVLKKKNPQDRRESLSVDPNEQQ